jgi:catechol 2,3-dioxygenase-like lactoylglutathione lyase family enzyme
VAIIRIERAVYGVTDLPACVRFFSDMGLEAVPSDGERSEFRTRTGQVVELRAEHGQHPEGPEQGPGVREVVWGVDDQKALDKLVASLRTDRPVDLDDSGTAHTRDETGFGVGFALTRPRTAEVQVVPTNVLGSVQRWNRPIPAPTDPVRPLRLCHVALNIPKSGRARAVGFYVERLGFRITDDVLPMGTFMQCEGDDDQHTMLLSHRPDRAGTNHTAYEVSSVDEVILAGNQMIARGWREARRLGRHTVGSNFFRFIHAPCGGRIEFAADMDRVDASYQTRVHESTPPHHLWTLETNRDADQ